MAGAAGSQIEAVQPDRATHRESTGPTFSVSKGEVRQTVTGTGAVRPLKSVLVGSQLSGQIADIKASFNSEVRAGDVLAILDDESFRSRVTQAKAELAAARAAHRTADGALLKAKAASAHAASVLNRQEALVKSNAGRQASLDDAKRDLEVAASEIVMAEAQAANAAAVVEHREALLQQAEIDLERTQIRAPISGIVLSRMVEVGQTVAASLQSPELFRIADRLDRIQIDAQISEAEIGEVRAGNSVTFTVDAYPDVAFVGEVSEVRLAPSSEQNIVTYTVVIDATNPDRKLYPGMTASVRIEVGKRIAALRIPSEAIGLRHSAAGEERQPGLETIWVDAGNGKAQARDIRLGLSDGRFTEILDGDLSEGDTVILPDSEHTSK